MKISFICSSAWHPVVNCINSYIAINNKEHDFTLHSSSKELKGGDILFLISCNEIIPKKIIDDFKYSFVLHASDLPVDRGWSPYVWQILEGKEAFTLVAISAEEKIDSGKIWYRKEFSISKDLLYYEINNIITQEEVAAIDYIISNLDKIVPVDQDNKGVQSYRRKRTPKDSEIDPKLSLENQFNSIRVADPERYPSFFYLHGERYKITIKKYNE